MKLIHQKNWPLDNQVGIVWLGQAGFWINTGHHKILIDPYLSDSLAKKYAGQANDHKRMVHIPITPNDLPKPDLVLITHSHTDHMDSETLAPLAQKYPKIPFYVPLSNIKIAKERIGISANIIGVDADETISFSKDLNIVVFPAAHETLEVDTNGHYLYLGYGIADDNFKLYHSGDTIPFSGLSERIHSLSPDIVLLPVNGRDKHRLNAGIPGNFTLEEAYKFAQNAKIFIPHHWGMFSFNTIDPQEILDFSRKNKIDSIILPHHGEALIIN